jgi:hypothetical protein
LPADQLTDRLGLAGEKVGTGFTTVLLPSNGSAPFPSTAAESGGTSSRLRPWRVPIVSIRDSALLRRIAADPVTPLGSSVGYVAAVAAFAEELTARGRALPAVLTAPGGPAARWLPALFGVDLTRFDNLCAAMPPVCRAEPAEPESIEGRPAADVLRAALATLVDSLVRRRIGDHATGFPAPDGTSALTAWWRALSGEPRFDAPPAAVHELTTRLADWHAELGRQRPVRTCFRLRAPDQNIGSDDWRLEILVQAVADPSVLVPAAEIWHGRDSVLHQWIDDPERQLLVDLGGASTIYPGLVEGLRKADPVDMSLDADGAYDFLTHVELLEQAGFAVQVPTWWRRPGELCLKVTTTSTEPAIPMVRDAALTMKEIVNCQWSIAIGGQAIPDEDLSALARAKIPLVRVRGQWAYVDRTRLAAGLAFLRKVRSGRMPAANVLLTAGLRPGADVPLPVTSAGSGWLAELLAGAQDSRIGEIDIPDEFVAPLRPYQRRGVAWLALLDQLGLGACLADDMGLGKTAQLLALEVLTRRERRRPPTLVICPTSVAGHWQREAERFAPSLSVHLHHGRDRATGQEFLDLAARLDLVITTYVTATRDIADLAGLTWDRVVLDEAQKIKNSGTRQAREIRRIPGRHRVALTGTPVENRLSELWSIMDFLNPGMLGSAHRFHDRFAVPIERHCDQDAVARLRSVTRPFLLRRVKTDRVIAPDLPSKIETKQLCNLTVEQASLYRAVVDDMLEQIHVSRDLRRKGLVLAAMTKLKQVCNHPAHLLGDGSPLPGRSGKLTRLEQLLDQVLADGDRALCFTQFVSFGTALRQHLADRFGTEVLFLHGGVSQPGRDAMVERFQQADGPAIFLVSLKAGGTGLTLTAANHVIHVDRWWNPAVEQQATDRAHRMGQHRTVQVHKLLCMGTLEEKIDQLAGDKTGLAQLVVGADDEWLTELSFAAIRDLITLSPEAIIE